MNAPNPGAAIMLKSHFILKGRIYIHPSLPAWRVIRCTAWEGILFCMQQTKHSIFPKIGGATKALYIQKMKSEEDKCKLILSVFPSISARTAPGVQLVPP